RLGNHRAEDVAGRRVAPLLEQTLEEGKDVALQIAGIGRGRRPLLALIDLQKKRRLARPPAIDRWFARPRGARDGLYGKAGKASFGEDRLRGFEDGFGAVRIAPGAYGFARFFHDGRRIAEASACSPLSRESA